jgi:hypothetical protein
MGTLYKFCRNTNAGFHVRRDSNPNISNKKLLLELTVLQCTLYKSIYFLIQLEQCLTPKSPCKGGNPHHHEGKNLRSTRQQPQHSKHNKSVGDYCALLYALQACSIWNTIGAVLDTKILYQDLKMPQTLRVAHYSDKLRRRQRVRADQPINDPVVFARKRHKSRMGSTPRPT